MISVIICSVNNRLAAQVKRNIDETIGVRHELIILDNSVSVAGICEVYNRGAKQAEFDILCFVHEDVLFQSKGWGEKILGYFANDSALGLVGIAGSKYKSKTPSGWATGLPAYDCLSIVHIDKEKRELRLSSNPQAQSLIQEVVTTDGVFMCSSKLAWQACNFNEEVLKGFHLYDIDFSYSISRMFKVIVSFEIDIIHLTEGGDFGNRWLENTLKWHAENKLVLPASTSDILTIVDEKIISKKWLHRLRFEKITLRNRFRWIFQSDVLKSIYLWPHIVVFLFYRPIKKLLK